MYVKHARLLVTVFLLCSIDLLQGGMVAFASAPIMGEVGASPEEFSLIAGFYACAAVLVISKQRWLTERLGWRCYILASVLIHVVGALICGTSASTASFAAGRIVMGIGGGAFFTSGRILVNQLPRGPARFVGIKVFACGVGSGIAAAPLIASLSVTYDDWSSIFWVLVAIASVAGTLAATWLPSERHPVESRSQSGPFRLVLLAGAAITLPYAIQRSAYEFYSDTTLWMAVAAGAVAALYLFFHIEHAHPTPLLRISELVAPRYVFGVALFCFAYFLLGANSYMLPIFMQRGLAFSWESTGEFQSIGLAAALLTWLAMARILPTHPAPKKFLITGFLALALAALQLSSLTPSASLWADVLPALALNGCFMMLVLATAAMQTFQEVGHEEALFAHAQQVKNMLGQFATAAGTAFATLLLQWRSTVQYGALNSRMTADDPLFQRQTEALQLVFAQTTDAAQAARMALALQAQDLSRQATLLAGIDYFWLVGIVALLALVVSACQRVFR